MESKIQNANPKLSDCAGCFRNFQPIVATAAISSRATTNPGTEPNSLCKLDFDPV